MELVKALREEVLVLRREVLRHAGCGGGSGSFACGNRWDGRRVGIL
jgi:hypothetical protein